MAVFYREILSAIAIFLTLAGVVPYIRAILAQRAKPHLFSWLIWGSTTFVVFLAQLSDGAGAGAWPIGVSGLLTFYIAWLAYQNRADVSFTRSDKWLLAIAMGALLPWFFTKDPLWTVVVLTTVDVIGFGPTLRKAYHHPHEESLTFFSLFALRNLISILALAHVSLTTALFPAATGAGCLALVILILYRRWQVALP